MEVKFNELSQSFGRFKAALIRNDFDIAGNLLSGLKCCAMPSSSDGHVSKDHLLEALQLDGLAPENASTIQPCITVLPNRNSQNYSGLKPELQELLFRKLVTAFHNSNGDIQNASRAALQHL